MYNIESLIQRGAASVQLNTDGGVLGVNVQTINPQYPSQGTTDIDAALLRDVKATLSNNAMPSVGMCNTSIVGGKILIVAPNNCPLIDGENLVVISGVYLNTMFVWSVSVIGVTEEHLTADVTVTLEDGDITGILSAIEPDIAAGKAELAEAITAKGVETSADAALSTMADKVGMIQQESYTIDGGEMYAKQLFGSLTTPNYWNLYDVMTALLNNTNPSEFGGILLGEYYKGYDSIAFGGSDAPSAGTGGGYVFSDEFSVAADGTVSFTIHRADEVHYWNDDFDGKGNRWVAWLFAGESHGFSISNTNTCPRSIHVGRHVGSIECTVNGRISEIVVTDGNLLDSFATGSYTQNWGREVVIRNLASQTGAIINNLQNTESVYLHGESIAGGTTTTATIRETSSSYIRSIVVYCNGEFKNCLCAAASANQVIHAYIRALSIGATTSHYSASLFTNGKLNLSLVTEEVTNGLTVDGCITNLYIGYITNDKTKSILLTQTWGDVSTLTDIKLQNGWCKPITMSTYSYLTEANMYAHILQRLKQDEPDCGDGVTITLGSTNLAKLTSEESVQLLDDLTNIYGYTFA